MQKRQLDAWPVVGSAWKASRASSGISFRNESKACESRPDFDSELLDIKSTAKGKSFLFSSSKVHIFFQFVTVVI